MRIVLIRHAQSLENVALHETMSGLNRLTRLELPLQSECSNAADLLFRHNKDSDISPQGLLQINDMSNILKEERFWENFEPSLIYCSPLTRAVKTCSGLLPTLSTITTVTNPSIDPIKLHVTYSEHLREYTPVENILSFTAHKRIKDFEHELFTQSTSHQRVVVVGHSQYFKKMLRLPQMMRNCDVVETEANFDDKGRCEWKYISLLYRTKHATTNPWTNGGGDIE